ncbi:hypothetical protein IFO70_06450 [Phormidium tenue FACHB-886]|nr:hypothetical protein [Phormidium tenue FACHB-886]
MVRPIQQIEQELTVLDQSVAAIATEFQKAYSQYLTVLSQAVRQQLILASYHLCTHGYPEQFLALSLSQRQDLQQALQHLAKQTQTELQELLQPVQAFASLQQQLAESTKAAISSSRIDSSKDSSKTNSLELEIAPEEGNLELALTPNELAFSADEEAPDVLEPEQPPEALLHSADTAAPSGSEATPLPPESPSQFLTPEELSDLPIYPKTIAQWQSQLEQSIVEQLQTLSHTANRLLQRAKILPSRLPEPVLEVAAKADIVSETAASPPNLLSLLVESESDDETSVTQLLTIRLRLAEIEFSDTNVGIWRSKIRSLLAQLNKLMREYQKRQTEKAIAQAEAAWRASWFEES